jgi:hypothetical protein
MTVKEWLEQKMCDASDTARDHELALEAARARSKAYLEMWKHLPAAQMEVQIAGEDPAKE